MRTLLYFFVSLLALAPFRVCAAVDHGATELAEFARERPEAAAVLGDLPEVAEFLHKAFEGEYTSVPLDWSNEEPQGNAYAENTPNDEGTAILVRVSARLLGPSDQVAALVYECRNAQNEKRFAQHIRDAYLGRLAKEEFIREILRLEHNKMKETRAFLSPMRFFREIDPSTTDFYRKMLNTPEDFEEFLVYLHQIKRPDYDVFDMYSKFYDYLTVTPQQHKAELDAQARQAASAGSAPAEAEAEGETPPAVPKAEPNLPATP